MKSPGSRQAGLTHAAQKTFLRHLLAAIIVTVMLLTGGYYLLLSPVYGAQLGFRSIQLSNDEMSVSTNYLLKFFLTTPGNLGSISIQFCANDPLIGDPCTAPAGFDDSAAVLSNQTGPSGFNISSSSTTNELILTRTPVFAPSTFVSYEFSGITNPSAPGSYYVRVQTFASNNVSGPASDYGGLAFAITNNLAISAEVPPFLIFCTGITITGLNCANASGDFLDFGALSTRQASSGSSQMLVATNGQSGYNITVFGTTMTSGNNVINPLTAGDVSRPGVGQFGFNLRANTTPPDGDNPSGPGTGTPTTNYDQANIYRFDSGDVVAANAGPEDLREFTSSYIVNVPATQPPGIYVSTMTYIALATF